MGKYKVGDKVRVKSLEWYENNRGSNGDINTSGNCFVRDMSLYCGKEATITQTGKGFGYRNYQIDIDEGYWYWPEEVLEDIPNKEPSTIYTDLANAINKVVSEHHQPVMIEEIEGGIIIKPIEEKEEDLPIDTPVMVRDILNSWILRYYAGKGKCFVDGCKSNEKKISVSYKEIVPFDKFNPNDIEESLKHNIVKHG